MSVALNDTDMTNYLLISMWNSTQFEFVCIY